MNEEIIGKAEEIKQTIIKLGLFCLTNNVYPPTSTVVDMKKGDTVGFSLEDKHWTITRDN